MNPTITVSPKDKFLENFQSLDFSEKAELRLQESYSKTGKDWFNYPLGVINELVQGENTISGIDMLFHGNLPIGAGNDSIR